MMTGKTEPQVSAHVSDAWGALDAGNRDLRIQLGICGDSPSLLASFELARRYAASGAPVLLRGQTGVGKEVFARAIHYMSLRRAKPFVPLNCGAIPDGLFEAEFFGVSKGAFTGAVANRPGLVEIAHTGTLFLDEIDSLPLKGQVALLRFLQESEFRRIGSGELRKADVRLIAATNAPLELGGAQGFREDLLFRLDVCGLNIPPLSERREDISALARHFLERLAARYRRPAPRLSIAAVEWCASRQWPGNLRQLENVLHRALAALAGDEIDADLLRRVCPAATAAPDAPARAADPLAQGPLVAARKRAAMAFERQYLSALIAAVGGNVSEAARRAGTERRAMGRMLKRHGLGRAHGDRQI